MYNIHYLRQHEFPTCNNVVYLNNAGISPLPQRTINRIHSVIEGLGRQPSGFWEFEAIPATLMLQNELAKYINAASPDEIAFATTTSSAINLFAQAIDWRPDQNIIICDVEFPSNAYPWLSLERDGIQVRRIPSTYGGLEVETLRNYIDENTRLVAASTVQFFTGHRTDLTAIGEFCQDHGVLFAVDAIQSIGHFQVDVQAMHIDLLATGGQKSLMALPGTGFIYVRHELAEKMRPRVIGSNATIDYLHWLAYDLTPLPGAARFNTGTPNLPGIFSIAASLDLIQELGVQAIDAHTQALSGYTLEALTNLGLSVITPRDTLGPIVTFRSPYSLEQTDQLVRFMAEKQIVVTKHLDAPGNPYIRLSFHCYNSEEDVDRFIEAFRVWTG